MNPLQATGSHPNHGRLSRNSDAAEVSREMIASDENVLPADSGLGPLAEELMAKITNVAKGPNIVGTKAAPINTRLELFSKKLT